MTNESVRQVALARGRKSDERVFVVRTAPKITTGDYLPDPALKKGRPYLVGYVGVMGSADGVSYLIDAAAHLVHKVGRKDVQFLLMGTGPEHPRLLAQRDRLGLREVCRSARSGVKRVPLCGAADDGRGRLLRSDQ